ncbi:MAG: hypothetical protein ACREH4_10360 [Vitreimonas sp.]
MNAPRRPAFASQDWMLEQQLRAELEAEAWRRLRELSSRVDLPPETVVTAAQGQGARTNFHTTGSSLLKAIVRFGLAACLAYIAWIAAVDARLSSVDVWLCVVTVFVVGLTVTLIGPARGLVHFLAETMRWGLIVAVALGGLWLLVQGQP